MRAAARASRSKRWRARVAERFGPYHLDGDRPIEPIVVRRVNDAHPSFANSADYPVATDSLHRSCLSGILLLGDGLYR
jgi:hypothetical protein